jgi:ribosome recycling factor
MTEAELVEQLARLPDEKRRDVTKAAAVARQRRIQTVVRSIRRTLLAPVKSHRKAALAIDDAKNHRHGRTDPALRIAIERELQSQLGYYDDVPGPETNRRSFGEQDEIG